MSDLDLEAKFDQYINEYGSIPTATQFHRFAKIKYAQSRKFLNTMKGRDRSTSTMTSNVNTKKLQTRPSSKSLTGTKARPKPKSKTKQSLKKVTNPSLARKSITETSSITSTKAKQWSNKVTKPLLVGDSITDTSNPYLDLSLIDSKDENEAFIKQYSGSPKIFKNKKQTQTKCTQMNCKCKTYIESTSKWSKGKCKTCSHTKQKHCPTQQQTNTHPSKTREEQKWDIGYIGRNRSISESTRVTNTQNMIKVDNKASDVIDWNNIATRQKSKSLTEIDTNPISNTTNPYVGSIVSSKNIPAEKDESILQTKNDAIPNPIDWDNSETRPNSDRATQLDNIITTVSRKNISAEKDEQEANSQFDYDEGIENNVPDTAQCDNIMTRQKSNSVPTEQDMDRGARHSMDETVGDEAEPELNIKEWRQIDNNKDDIKTSLDVDGHRRIRSESVTIKKWNVNVGVDDNKTDMIWDKVITRGKSKSVIGIDINPQLIEQSMDPKVKQYIDIVAGQKSYERSIGIEDDDVKSAQLNVDNGDNNDNIHDSDTIIIDNGSEYMKIGFGCTGDSHKPSNIFKSVIGFDKMNNETYIGDIAYNKNEYVERVKVYNVINRGNITNWDYMEQLWEYSFDKLLVSPDEYNVVLTETVLRSDKEREKSVEVLFESFNVKSMYLQNEACLSLYANGLWTGTVLGVGYGSTYCASIFEGFPVPHSVFKINSAGYDLTQYLKLLLSNKHKLFTQTKQRYDKIVNEIKHKYCFVADSDLNNVKSRRIDKYRLPDGEWIEIDAERYKCSEQLFGGFINLSNESIQGQNKNLLSDKSGIQNLIYESIQSVDDDDARKEFYSNIIVSGGSTLFDNLPNRLRQEISKLESNSNVEIKIIANEKRKDLSWIGGSVASSFQQFKQNFIQNEEYQETGKRIVHTKCPS